MSNEFGFTDFGLDGTTVSTEASPIDEIRDKLDDIEETLESESKENGDDEKEEVKFDKVDEILGKKGKKKKDDEDEEESDEEEEESEEDDDKPKKSKKSKSKDDDEEEVDEKELTASKESLEDVSVSLEWLRDLHYTISKEGVSQADITALGEIRSRLMQHGVEFTPTPALETYALGMYLDTRSNVNLTVAQESFASTMIQTIKRWISTLIEYLGKMIRWATQQFLGEEASQRKLTKYHKQYTSAQKWRRTFEQAFPANSHVKTQLKKHASTLLNDDKLERDRLTVAAFTDIKDDKVFTTHARDASEAAKRLGKEIDNLKKDLERNTQNLSVDDSTFTQLGIHAMQIEEFTKPQPMAGYVANKVSVDVFEMSVKDHTTKVTPFNDLIVQYSELHKRLKQIRRIENTESVDRLVDVLNEVMRCVGHIGAIANGVRRYNQVKAQVLRQFLSYENAYISLLFHEGTHHGGPDVAKRLKEYLASAKKDVTSIDIEA